MASQVFDTSLNFSLAPSQRRPSRRSRSQSKLEYIIVCHTFLHREGAYASWLPRDSMYIRASLELLAAALDCTIWFRAFHLPQVTGSDLTRAYNDEAES